MPSGKIVVFMGSQKDYEFAARIQKFLQQEFNTECDYVVASAHKTPRKLLDVLDKHENAERPMVFITVAGLSDALSGVVAGFSKYPVIACPPDSEKFWWAKFFSSAVTPQGVSVAYIPRPENAALAAVKMIALSDESLQRKVAVFMQRLREKGQS
jgi:5-(carboxyamino)imidazole ribonucleotide mutase